MLMMMMMCQGLIGLALAGPASLAAPAPSPGTAATGAAQTTPGQAMPAQPATSSPQAAASDTDSRVTQAAPAPPDPAAAATDNAPATAVTGHASPTERNPPQAQGAPPLGIPASATEASPPSPAHVAPWYRGAAGERRVAHLGATATLGLLYYASEVAKETLTPASCRWCAPSTLDRHARALRWQTPTRADDLSDILVYAVMPSVTLGAFALLGEGNHERTRVGAFLDDALPVLEAVGVGQLATQALKYSFARQRPLAHFATEELPRNVDYNRSFVSGHTSWAVGLVVSAGTVAHLRGARSEPWIWGIGLPLAATAGYLRIAADRHYATDVIGGAVVGALAGYLVPTVLHGRYLRTRLRVFPTGNGAAISGTF